MFAKRVKEVRERELHVILKFAILESFESFAWTASMFWASGIRLTSAFILVVDLLDPLSIYFGIDVRPH